MQLHIRSQGLEFGSDLRAHCERRVLLALSRFADRLAQVTVRLADVNGPRGGVDKRCQLVIQVRGGRQLVVSVEDTQLNAAMDRAADRAGHAVARELERERELLPSQ